MLRHGPIREGTPIFAFSLATILAVSGPLAPSTFNALRGLSLIIGVVGLFAIIYASFRAIDAKIAAVAIVQGIVFGIDVAGLGLNLNTAITGPCDK